MIEVQLSPKATRTITLVLSSPAYRQWELREEEVSSESNPTWSSFIVSYPAAPETAFTEYLSDVSDLSGDSDLFAPHSEYTDRILYPGPWTNEEPDLSEAKLLNRYFIYFSFGDEIVPSDVKVTNLYSGSNLQIDIRFDKMEIIDELKNYWK